MSISFKHTGDFGKTTRFFKKAKTFNIDSVLRKYGEIGVNKLSSVTPIDTGKTAASWTYTITNKGGISTITWSNTNKNEQGIPIVILLVYGHGTSNGYYIKGRDFVKPTMRPIFDDIAKEAWEEVING